MDKFLQFAESLKLIRKACIEDDNDNNIIEDIYTDLLPNDGVIKKVNLPRTTIITGRKGTGKSTIFQKSIFEKNKDKKTIPVYIDTKTIYDNSVPNINFEEHNILPPKEIKKFFLYTNFMKEVIENVQESLHKKLNQKYIVSKLGLNDERYSSLCERLDKIKSENENIFKRIDLTLINRIKENLETESQNKSEAGLKVAKNPSLNISLSNTEKGNVKKEFSNILGTYLDIKSTLIANLLSIKEILSIKYIFLYLDDFSELDEDAQKMLIDWFVAPLNNLAKDFVKFKIATYPKRFYYGELDNQKIDEISLDFFDAYYTYELNSRKLFDISYMEDMALDYTKRLIENRISIYFPDNGFFDYFSIKPRTIYKALFEVGLNNPRKLGYILSFCHDACLINGKKITKKDIENASVRYFDTVISKYFRSNPLIRRPFDDKVSIENQYSLLLKLISRQKDNKKSISKSNEKIFQVPKKPTSHFVVNEELTYLLDNLELNNYITTYNKIKDTNGLTSTLYSIDFGMCRKYSLNFGRPKDTKQGKYYRHPRFNMNRTIMEHFNSTQLLKCDNNHEYPYELYDEFKRFHFNCPKCMEQNVFSKCTVVNSNKEIIEKINKLERKTYQLSLNEFMILDTIKTSSPSPMSIQGISGYVDLGVSTIQNALHKLSEKGFLELDEDRTKGLNKDMFSITTKGIKLVESILKAINKMEESEEKLLSPTSGHKTLRG